eukprot:1157776-Pelagomonas_calceolata.AAC.1
MSEGHEQEAAAQSDSNKAWQRVGSASQQSEASCICVVRMASLCTQAGIFQEPLLLKRCFRSGSTAAACALTVYMYLSQSSVAQP